MNLGTQFKVAEKVCDEMTSEQLRYYAEKHYQGDLYRMTPEEQWKEALEHDLCPICGSKEYLHARDFRCNKCGYIHSPAYGPLGQARAEREYKYTGVKECPYCGSSESKKNINSHTMEFIIIDMSCTKCGRSWMETYYLKLLEFDCGELVRPEVY